MRNIFLLLILVTCSVFSQNNPAKFKNGVETKFISIDTLTTTERDALTVVANKGTIIFNSTTEQYEGYNPITSSWGALGGSSDNIGNTNLVIPDEADRFLDVGSGGSEFFLRSDDLGSYWQFGNTTHALYNQNGDIRLRPGTSGSFDPISVGDVPIATNTVGGWRWGALPSSSIEGITTTGTIAGGDYDLTLGVFNDNNAGISISDETKSIELTADSGINLISKSNDLNFISSTNIYKYSGYGSAFIGSLDFTNLTANRTLTLSDETGINATRPWVETYVAANSGGLENLVEDTTPQLGGNLDGNAFSINNLDQLSVVGGDVVFTNNLDVKNVYANSIDVGGTGTNVLLDNGTTTALSGLTGSITAGKIGDTPVAVTQLQFQGDDVTFSEENGVGTVSVNSLSSNFEDETITVARDLTSADNGKILYYDGASDVIVTVPTGLDDGYNVTLIPTGTGKIQVDYANGVTGTTIETDLTDSLNVGGTIFKRSGSEAYFQKGSWAAWTPVPPVVNLITGLHAANPENDTDATVDWYSENNTVDISSEPNGDGTFIIRGTANTAGTVRLNIDFPVVSGETYTLSFDGLESSGDDARLIDFENVTINSTVLLTDSLSSYSRELTATATGTATLGFFIYSATVSTSYIEIDNLSIIQN